MSKPRSVASQLEPKQTVVRSHELATGQVLQKIEDGLRAYEQMPVAQRPPLESFQKQLYEKLSHLYGKSLRDDAVGARMDKIIERMRAMDKSTSCQPIRSANKGGARSKASSKPVSQKKDRAVDEVQAQDFVPVGEAYSQDEDGHASASKLQTAPQLREQIRSIKAGLPPRKRRALRVHLETSFAKTALSDLKKEELLQVLGYIQTL